MEFSLSNSVKHSHWEANSHSACQEVPLLSWNPRFIAVFTRACHWSISWARWIHSTHL